MQTTKPGEGSGTTGAHVAPRSAHRPLGFPTQTSAAVVQVPGDGGPADGAGATLGVHPLSLTPSGAIESDCTQGTPLQSFPAGTAFAAVQAPVHAAGASNVVELPEQSG
jgi:hypothetical protein